jgi:hypothetical protein
MEEVKERCFSVDISLGGQPCLMPPILVLIASVSDLDPDWIRIPLGQRIRIRIQEQVEIGPQKRKK